MSTNNSGVTVGHARRLLCFWHQLSTTFDTRQAGQVNCNGNKFTVVLCAFGGCGFALCETNNVCWTVFFELVNSTVTVGRVDTGGDF